MDLPSVLFGALVGALFALLVIRGIIISRKGKRIDRWQAPAPRYTIPPPPAPRFTVPPHGPPHGPTIPSSPLKAGDPHA